MFKKIKELISYIRMIPTILDSVSTIKKELKSIKKEKQAMPIPELSFSDMELYQTKENMVNSIREVIEHDYHNVDDLHKCIIDYDTCLYKATSTIDNSPINLEISINKLEIIKEQILEILFNDKNVFSFYLYLTDTEIFRDTVDHIPLINVDKAFVISLEDSTDELPFELVVENYIIVTMTRTTLTVKSPYASVEFSSKYRRTVLRALYSIYMNKLYLYHLDKRGIV